MLWIKLFSSPFFIVKYFNLFPQGHSSYITHLDWSPDNKFIMSNSGDYEILYCKCLTAKKKKSSLWLSFSEKHCPIIFIFLCLWVKFAMTVSACGLCLPLDQKLLKCCVFLTFLFPSSTGDIPNGCKLIRNRSECKDIDWASYTCVLGFHVFGQYLWSDALWDLWLKIGLKDACIDYVLWVLCMFCVCVSRQFFPNMCLVFELSGSVLRGS